jgi:hypothetical protein
MAPIDLLDSGLPETFIWGKKKTKKKKPRNICEAQ